MELLDRLTTGHDVTIYNVLGPIMLVVLVFGVVLLHRPRNKPIKLNGSFVSRVRAAVASGYLSKEEGAEIIAKHQ